MNVTELARRLNMQTQELRDLMPQLGFDIGQKAIKVDDKAAFDIIKKFPKLMSDYRKKQEYQKQKEERADTKEMIAVSKDIELPKMLTVREFAALLDLPVSQVITELMKNGIMASLNERLDFDTASIIAQDFGYNVKVKEDDEILDATSQEKLKAILEEGKSCSSARPPVVVVMGHVDHGKTKLLDTIRMTNVVDKEAGGITQHIGAYQAKKKNCIITFIDTPGHEAFTAMRSRGARVADIAILIVAADDGVMPQTVEALRIIQNSKLPFIVAINKIDKEDANIDKVKTELAKYNVLPEEWGGKTMMIPISAKAGLNIDDLLDAILLINEEQKDKIVADSNRMAAGTVIESHVDKGEGSVATILIQTGTLRKGDNLAINGVFYGRIRQMKDYNGKVIDEATPSMPVKVIGLKLCPKVGDLAEVVENAKDLMKLKQYKAEKMDARAQAITRKDKAEMKLFNVVVKADVLGSLEAIIESLEKIESDYIRVDIVSKGLGNFTENDLQMAQASQAMLIGFNIAVSNNIASLAQEKNIEIHTFKIIYKLIETIKQKMEEFLGEEVIKKDLGKLEVLAIFKTEKKAMIVGGKVLDGAIEFNPKKIQTKVNVIRKGEYITDGKLEQLQSGKQDVTIVEKGQECGIRFAGNPIIMIGDILEFFTEEKKKRVL